MYMPTDRFLEHVLDEHNERRRRREGEEFVARGMVDLLLQLADDPNLEVTIKRGGVKAFTLAFQMEQDLIVAAPDTSAVTLEWATRNSSRSRRSSPRPPRSWTASSADHAHPPGRGLACSPAVPRGHVCQRLRHPRPHTCTHQRVGHRPRSSAGGRTVGV